MKKTLACTLALALLLAAIPVFTMMTTSAEMVTVEGANDFANYTLYSSNTATSVTTEEGWPIVSPATAGAKKAILKDVELEDFTASYTTVLDENGRTYNGLIFHGSQFGSGQDAQSSFICVLERKVRDGVNNAITLKLQKYGKSADGTADKWLGPVPLTREEVPETDPLNGETKAGTELILKAEAKGNTFTASVELTDGTKLYELEADLTAKAEKEESLGVDYSYTKGAVGFYMTNDGGYRPYNKIKDIVFSYDDGTETTTTTTEDPTTTTDEDPTTTTDDDPTTTTDDDPTTTTDDDPTTTTDDDPTTTTDDDPTTTTDDDPTTTTDDDPTTEPTTTPTTDPEPEDPLNPTTFEKPADGVEPGPLDDISSYVSFSMGEQHIQLNDGKFTADTVGNKKILLKNSWVDDFTASVTVKVDENGNLKTGIPFRVVYADNGRDGLEGYLCVIQRIAGKNRFDIIVYKYGELNGKIAYMGEVGRSVNEGKDSIIADMPEGFAGQELVLTLKVEGKKATASFCLKDQPDKVSKTLECWLNMKTTKETTLLAKYYEAGAIGLYMGEVSATEPINSLAYDFTVKLPGEDPGTEDPGTEDPDDDKDSPSTGHQIPVAIVGLAALSAAALLLVRPKKS